MIPGFGEKTAKKFVDAGYTESEELFENTPESIAEKTGVSLKIVEKLIASIEKQGRKEEMKTARKMLEEYKTRRTIPFGIEPLDELLGGGIDTGQITEYFGEFASGKTQVCEWLVAQALKMFPKLFAFWNDTENSFRPTRQLAMIRKVGGDESWLDRIEVLRSFTVDDQIAAVENMKDFHGEHPISIVVIDSLTNHFRNEFLGRESLPDRARKMNPYLHDMMEFAERENLAIVVTNQVQSKPDMFFGDPTEAYGGHILKHASKVRCYLRKGKAPSRIMRLVDSPHLPDGERPFIITETGLEELKK